MHSADRQPAVFIGHGSPMNAIQDNHWSRALQALAPQLRKPRAILVISAHWFVPGSVVTAQASPETLHDFGGFPAELYAVSYPAAGDPDLAHAIAAQSGGRIRSGVEWGFDHGSWSVLRHLFPAADVPVLQLSIDTQASPAQHLELGRLLGTLRDEGVLILGSGNIVHNLPHAMRAMRQGDIVTPGWAARFDTAMAQAAQTRDLDTLQDALTTADGRQAHPTPEHYLPLLYVVGASRDDDEVSFPVTGFDLASLSMRSICFRPPTA